jgi:hypothetical protein
MASPEFRLQRTTGFANNLQVVDDPGLNQFIPLKSLSSAHRLSLDSRDRLEDVAQPDSVVSHKGTASLSMASRI